MSDFYTGKGDDGFTGLLGEARVPKFSERPSACGAIDESSAAIGLARSLAQDERSAGIAKQVQRDLYHIMSEVAATAENAERFRSAGPAQVGMLEEWIEQVGGVIELPNGFILGGDTQAGAAFDLARTVVRRAEREVARLVHAGEIDNRHVLRYLNRLSSLLFLLVLLENNAGGVNQPSLAASDGQ